MENPIKSIKSFLAIGEENQQEIVENSSEVHSPTLITTASSYQEIKTFTPKNINEATQIGETFRKGVPVVINLTDLDENIALRFIDFASGLKIGLNGSIKRITPRVLILSPESIKLNNVESEKTEKPLTSDNIFDLS